MKTNQKEIETKKIKSVSQDKQKKISNKINLMQQRRNM